jgi:hypothetical protein
MSIIQDLYKIYDSEQAKYRANRSSKGRLLIEMQHNMGFLREGLRQGLSQRAIVAGLEDVEFRAATKQGTNLGALQKRRLGPATYAGIREFDRYNGWDTGRLIENVYERIAILKKIEQGAENIDLRARLKTLFKFLMVVLAHLEGRQLAIPAPRRA